MKTNNTSPFKPVKKGMKKLDITKYKKRMSCSVEITENKIDFEEDEELLNVVRKTEKRGRLRRR